MKRLKLSKTIGKNTNKKQKRGKPSVIGGLPREITQKRQNDTTVVCLRYKTDCISKYPILFR